MKAQTAEERHAAAAAEIAADVKPYEHEPATSSIPSPSAAVVAQPRLQYVAASAPVLGNDRGHLVPNALRSDDAYGRLTHIERINPGDNPAYVPGMSAGAYERAQERRLGARWQRQVKMPKGWKDRREHVRRG